jgi:hypothetical protein
MNKTHEVDNSVELWSLFRQLNQSNTTVPELLDTILPDRDVSNLLLRDENHISDLIFNETNDPPMWLTDSEELHSSSCVELVPFENSIAIDAYGSTEQALQSMDGEIIDISAEQHKLNMKQQLDEFEMKLKQQQQMELLSKPSLHVHQMDSSIINTPINSSVQPSYLVTASTSIAKIPDYYSVSTQPFPPASYYPAVGRDHEIRKKHEQRMRCWTKQPGMKPLKKLYKNKYQQRMYYPNRSNSQQSSRSRSHSHSRSVRALSHSHQLLQSNPNNLAPLIQTQQSNQSYLYEMKDTQSNGMPTQLTSTQKMITYVNPSPRPYYLGSHRFEQHARPGMPGTKILPIIPLRPQTANKQKQKEKITINTKPKADTLESSLVPTRNMNDSKSNEYVNVPSVGSIVPSLNISKIMMEALEHKKQTEQYYGEHKQQNDDAYTFSSLPVVHISDSSSTPATTKTSVKDGTDAEAETKKTTSTDSTPITPPIVPHPRDAEDAVKFPNLDSLIFTQTEYVSQPLYACPLSDRSSLGPSTLQKRILYDSCPPSNRYRPAIKLRKNINKTTEHEKKQNVVHILSLLCMRFNFILLFCVYQVRACGFGDIHFVNQFLNRTSFLTID